MANSEALHKVLAHIKNNPDQWDQHRWHKCFAGWTLRLCVPGIEVRTDELDISIMYGGNGKPVWQGDIAPMARKLLELTGEQAYDLFSQYNDLAYLEALVAEFTAVEAVPA